MPRSYVCGCSGASGYRWARGPSARTVGGGGRRRPSSSFTLAPSHLMHRERVMHLLWAHLRGEAAANNLHRNLYVARRNIEPDPLTGSRCLTLYEERLSLCLEGDLWVDVETFEQAAEAARRSRDPAA